MITPSFSLTATERVLPKLALDFTTANLDSRVTFTRALSTATRVNSSGVIASVAADTPRFDYDPVALTCKGLLIEESRTNLLLYSSDLNGASWSSDNGDVTTDVIVSPDGTQNADLLSRTTGVGRRNQVITTLPSTTYTATAYIKKNASITVRFDIDTTGGIAPTIFNSALYNIDTATVTSVSAGATAAISLFSNGWYKITLTVTTGTTHISSIVRCYAADASTTGSTYWWGLQYEAGAFATSYIPTTTLAVTRNADVATMTGTNFSSWFNQSAGSFKAEVNMPQIVQAGRVFAIDSGAITNQIDVTTIAGGQFAFEVISGGVYIGNIVSSNAISANANVSVAMAYSDSATEGLSLSANTTQTASLAYPAGIANLRLGQQGNGVYLNGYLRKFAFWPQRLINAELQAFSK